MEKFEELERYTRSNFVLTRWVQASSKQLKVSRNFPGACTVAKGNFVYSGSVYHTKTLVAGGGGGALHTGMVKMYDKANLLEGGPNEGCPVPALTEGDE